MKLFLILSGGINSLLTVRYDLNCVDNTPFFLIVNVLHVSSQTIIFAHLHHFAKRFCTLFGWQGLNHTQTRTNLEVLMSCKIYTPYNGFFQQTTNFLFFFDMQAPDLHTIQYWKIYKILIEVKIIKTAKIIYKEDLAHHVGRWLIRKTFRRVKTNFKGAHNLYCEISWLQVKFG